MVKVAGGFCIDRMEVTWDQYNAWLATNPSPVGGAPCSWKTTHQPVPECMAGEGTYYEETPAHTINYDDWDPPYVDGPAPVACVDWCDAKAYCAAVGKRLCGKMGGGDGDYGYFDDQTQSEWQNACASGSANNYFTYGGSGYADANASACNSYELGFGRATTTSASPNCQSSVNGYEGVFDLNGNVWEWENACIADVQDDLEYCRARGGSFSSNADSNACGQDDGGMLRFFAFSNVGFRCCADAL
jgi:formylglycine-generating enzyme